MNIYTIVLGIPIVLALLYLRCLANSTGCKVPKGAQYAIQDTAQDVAHNIWCSKAHKAWNGVAHQAQYKNKSLVVSSLLGCYL